MNDPKILMVMAILLCVSLVRKLVQRQCAISMPSHISPIFCGVWMLGFGLAAWPVFGHMWHEAWPTLVDKPWIAALALSKGAVLGVCINLVTKMRRVSSGSCEYAHLMAIGMMAVGNALMGEVLTGTQWIAVVLMCSLGLVFSLKGDLTRLDRSYKLLFVALIFTGSTPGIFDQAVIPHTNWYSYLLLSAVGMISYSLAMRPSKADLKMAFTGRAALLGGITFGLGEVIILSLLVTHIPVTLGAAAMRLTTPTIMMIAAMRWGEGNIRNQIAFGILGYLAILPIVLG